MIKPEFLSEGDVVALISTARKIDEESLESAIEEIEQWGLQVLKAPNLHQSQFQFSGTDEQRAQDLSWALQNPEIKAIICVRGGYGTVRILDPVDFSILNKHPKWICGFSDVTALHNHVLSQTGICSIHSTMPISFSENSEESKTTLKDALYGNLAGYKLNGEFLTGSEIQGRMIGGNLSVLYSLLGSNSLVNMNGKVLFIEDIDEMLYHLDRMLIAMTRNDFLNGIKGIVVGGMTDFRDNTRQFGWASDNPYGKDALGIIKERLCELNCPVYWGFPSGHISNNLAWYHGGEMAINSNGISFR